MAMKCSGWTRTTHLKSNQMCRGGGGKKGELLSVCKINGDGWGPKWKVECTQINLKTKKTKTRKATVSGSRSQAQAKANALRKAMARSKAK